MQEIRSRQVLCKCVRDDPTDTGSKSGMDRALKPWHIQPSLAGQQRSVPDHAIGDTPDRTRVPQYATQNLSIRPVWSSSTRKGHRIADIRPLDSDDQNGSQVAVAKLSPELISESPRILRVEFCKGHTSNFHDNSAEFQEQKPCPIAVDFSRV
jgi:hypothetical protein